MRAFGVVERYPVADHPPGLEAVGDQLVADGFGQKFHVCLLSLKFSSTETKDRAA